MEVIEIKVSQKGAKAATTAIEKLDKAVESLKAKGTTFEFKVKPVKVTDIRKEFNHLGSEIASEFRQAGESASNFGHGIETNVSRPVRKAGDSFQDAEKKGSSLLKNVIKNAEWYYISGAVSAITRSFKEALATMKEVDTELVAIQKVTNNTDAEMASLSEHAYEVASQYGVAVADYLESVGTFAKAGYKDMSEDMAELATKTQLVGDVNSKTANQFLLSADAAYKMKGNVEELSGVLDRANEIENNYATSIQKMAEGFPIVANVASMANMSIDETMAALGTITAVTQESGSKAATALRALILNIIGDTETEIEDGVTWTKEEIEGLNDVLWVYAEDAMKAADAAGKIVDPMKAVAALAEAYKDGVLTQAQLAEIETKLGGKLRTNQLDALIKNYDMYAEMLDKVASAAGSADKEVSIMLNSWESKSNILKNKWSEFINNILDTDLVKGALDGVIKLVELLDSDFGHFIVTVGGVGSIVIGLVSAFKALAAAIAAINMASLITPLGIAAAAVGALVFAIQEIKKAYDESHKSFEELNKILEETQTEIQDTTDKLQEYKEKLKELSEVSIEDRGSAWASERAELELNIQASESYLEILERIAELNGKAAYETPRSVGYSAASSIAKNEYKDDFYNGDYLVKDNQLVQLSNRQAAVVNAQYKDEYIALQSIVMALSDASDEAYQLLDENDLTSLVGKSAEEQITLMTEMLDKLGIHLESTYETAEEAFSNMGTLAKQAANGFSSLTKEQQENAVSYIDDYEQIVKYLSSSGDGITEEQKRQTENYVQLKAAVDDFSLSASSNAEKVAWLANTLQISSSEAATLATNIGLLEKGSKRTAEGVVKLADGTYAAKTACKQLSDGTWELIDAQESLNEAESAAAELSPVLQTKINAMIRQYATEAKQAGLTGQAIYDEIAAEIAFNNNNLDVSQKLSALATLAKQAGYTAAAIASIQGGMAAQYVNEDQIRGYMRAQQLKGNPVTREEAEKALLKEVWAAASRQNRSKLESADDWLSDFVGGSDGTGSGSSGSGGGGSSSDARLTAHKERVTLLKSELTLLEKQGASEDAQKAKMREIQDALSAQADYMRSIGASQADINDLSSEWYDWQKKIKEQTKSMDDLLSELKDAMQDSLSSQQDTRDAELAALDVQLDALKRQKETKDDQLTLEEKILAVQKAQADLANAQNERTVRQWNASTGQWEWVADEGNVKSAKDSLEKAEKDLKDFQDDLAYNAAVAEIEARKDAINAQYDALERQYNNFLDSLKAKTRGIGEILQDIWKNATPELKKIILENADIFRQFGVDVSKLSDAVNETANRIVKVGADGKAPSGLSVGDRVVTGGGTYEIIGVNPDGTYQSQLVDKNQTTYNYGGQYDAPPGGDSSGGSGGSGSGLKYSGTVYAYAQDGSRYTISSQRGLDFLNYEAAGARMTGGDGTSWLKNYDGTTSITKKDGKVYTVYDRGGILEGIGGIKATAEPEMVLPPDITKAIQNMLLVPQADARFERGMDRMRAALCGDLRNSNVFAGSTYDDHHVGTQQNGCNFYSFGGVTISEGRARGMSVADFARSAATLAIQKNM